MDQIVLQLALKRIQELSYDESPRLNRILRMKIPKEIQIGFTVSMDPDCRNDRLGLRLGVVYYTVIEGMRYPLIEYKTLFSFGIFDLQCYLQLMEGEQVSIKPELFGMLLGIAIGSVRGMLAVKTAGSLLEDYPLPVINLTSLLHSIRSATIQDRELPPVFSYKIV